MSARTVVESIQDIMRQDSGGDGDAQRTSQLCWMFFLKIIDDQASISPTQTGPAVSAPHWKQPVATSGAESVLASSGPGVDCHAAYPADLTRYIASDVRIR